MKMNKPFATKGFNITTPKGGALWCKVAEPDTKYNSKGEFSTSLVCDPKDPAVIKFIEQLEKLRDTVLEETQETLGAKGKGITVKDVFAPDYDQDGNETDKIVFKMKMKDIADRKQRGDQAEIVVVDSKVQPIKPTPLVGNGSVIRCSVYANPYYMASTKSVGISLIWTKIQVIDLVEFGGGNSEFEEEDGFTASADAPFEVEEDTLDF